MRRFDLVVWDWDGTVIDSIGAVSKSMLLAAEDLGFARPRPEDARWVIGLGLTAAISHVVPSIQSHQIPAFVDRYRAHYLKYDPELNVFDGLSEVLRGLDAAGVPLAVATGKSRAGLDRALSRTGLGRHFVLTRCADEGLPKPDPWMLRDICETLEISVNRAVMIGDTTHDVAMAKAAGTASVAVAYGAHGSDLLQASEPNALFDSVPELADWLSLSCEVDRAWLGAQRGST